MTQEEYRVEVKIKNNLLYERIMQAGFSSVLAFSREPGCATVYNYINMLQSPLADDGSWRAPVLAICEALCCFPEDIFSETQMQTALETNKFTKKVSEAEARFMLAGNVEPILLEDSRAADERDKAIYEMLETLTPKEIKVIKMRFGLGEYEQAHTLREVGDAFGVTVERVRQLEIKALRKMRHPLRSGTVREFLE